MFKILKAQQGGQLTLETGFEMPTVDVIPQTLQGIV